MTYTFWLINGSKSVIPNHENKTYNQKLEVFFLVSFDFLKGCNTVYLGLCFSLLRFSGAVKAINLKLLLKIGYRAFIVVLKKRSEVYKGVIQILQKKYLLKYIVGLKEIHRNVNYFKTLPENFRNLSMYLTLCLLVLTCILQV